MRREALGRQVSAAAPPTSCPRAARSARPSAGCSTTARWSWSRASRRRGIAERDGRLGVSRRRAHTRGRRGDRGHRLPARPLAALGELRLDLDDRVEAPRALAPLIDPNLHSCGSVPPHGVDELSHPDERRLRCRHEELRPRADVPAAHRLRAGPLGRRRAGRRLGGRPPGRARAARDRRVQQSASRPAPASAADAACCGTGSRHDCGRRRRRERAPHSSSSDAGVRTRTSRGRGRSSARSRSPRRSPGASSTTPSPSSCCRCSASSASRRRSSPAPSRSRCSSPASPASRVGRYLDRRSPRALDDASARSAGALLVFAWSRVRRPGGVLRAVDRHRARHGHGPLRARLHRRSPSGFAAPPDSDAAP